MSQPSIVEFLAGVGLVRSGMEAAGFQVAWGNDISSMKHATYAANFDAYHYRLCDIAEETERDLKVAFRRCRSRAEGP